jgi:predicted nucleotidyltransferase
MVDVADRIRTALRGRSDVALALVFGSSARGTARPESDVDLAVEAAPHLDVLTLASDLTRALGREVDVVRLEGAGVPLLEEIVRDGVVAHEGVPHAHARWRSRTLCDLETDRPWFARMRDAWLRRVAERGL